MSNLDLQFGMDNIQSRILVISAEIIADPLSNVINATTLDEQLFSSFRKGSLCDSRFKKENTQTKTNLQTNQSSRFLRDSY